MSSEDADCTTNPLRSTLSEMREARFGSNSARLFTVRTMNPRAPRRQAKAVKPTFRERVAMKTSTPADVVAELRAEIAELKETVMALGVLRDVQKIAVPATQHAPGSASTRDWSKVPTEKLIALHGKFLPGSPKHNASRAELTARGIE